MHNYIIEFDYWDNNVFKIGDIVDTGINEINENEYDPRLIVVECDLDKFKIETIDEISNDDGFHIVFKGKCSAIINIEVDMNNVSTVGMNASFPFQSEEDIIDKLKSMNVEIPSDWEPSYQGFEVYEDNGNSVVLTFINYDEYPLYDYLFEIDKSEIVKFSY